MRLRPIFSRSGHGAATDTSVAELHTSFTMAKSKQAKVAKKQEESVQQPTPPAQEASDDGSDVEFVTETELEKDDAEEELERLVFGDSEGFRDGLRDFKLDDEDAEEGEEEGGDAENGLEGMDDADVGGTLESKSMEAVSLTCRSFSSPILRLQRTRTKHPRIRTRTSRLPSSPLHGRIVTMSA